VLLKITDIANNIARANNIILVNTSYVDQQKIETFIASNPLLLSYDKTLINQYVELVRSRFLRNNVLLTDSLLNQSTKLIKELNDKYNLGNE
jgi:hypothetical protein